MKHDFRVLQKKHETYLEETRTVKREKLILQKFFAIGKSNQAEELVNSLVNGDSDSEKAMEEIQTTTDYSDVERNLSPYPK